LNCSGCAHAIPASAKFCPECGASQARAGGGRLASLREARRLVTEMGATGHAERVAPLLAQLPR